jgi:hypothetical protein
MKTGGKESITDSLPERFERKEVSTYSWDGWETPLYHTFLKESYAVCRDAFSRIPEGG